MRWVKKDIQQYIQAKEYVDTIVVPLKSFNLSGDSDIVKSGFQGEVLSIFIKELEKELAGRVMLTPNYTYLKNADKQDEVIRINNWINDSCTQPFNHTFLITFDSTWKKFESTLNGTLLWLPGIQSGDLYSKEIQSIIQDQVTQISELIKSYWEN